MRAPTLGRTPAKHSDGGARSRGNPLRNGRTCYVTAAVSGGLASVNRRPRRERDVAPVGPAEAKRILDGAAQRLLAARLDADALRSPPGCDLDALDDRADKGTALLEVSRSQSPARTVIEGTMAARKSSTRLCAASRASRSSCSFSRVEGTSSIPVKVCTAASSACLVRVARPQPQRSRHRRRRCREAHREASGPQR